MPQQPIKKNIKEAHAEMMKEEPFYTLLVDGNSLLFSCMADDKKSENGQHYGGIFQFLLQLKMMMSKKDFSYVYVFFDNEYSGLLRYNLYKPYKATRDKHYEDYGVSDYMKAFNEKMKGMTAYFKQKNREAGRDNLPKRELTKSELWERFIDENFDRERDCLCRYFNELYIRWNIDETTEGDDQIAYYCLNKKPNERIVIMSGDMDLSQLLAEDVIIYNTNPKIKKFVTTKNFKELFGYDYRNVLVKKVFTGDDSDNIGNIKGLSEEGFFKLMPEVVDRAITVDEVIERSKALIDERVREKKKPYKLHENIVNGVSNKPYEGDFYLINQKIIDLKHPLMSDSAKEEMDAMMYTPQDPEGRSFANLYRFILEDGVDELKGDTKFTSFFRVFKRLEEMERKRYEESLK